MTTFRVGTSGWHYKHWAGDFYPPGLPPARWLTYYAEHFDTVELNASFYRQPKEEAWKLWRETTPPGFTFAVKASRFITHLKRLDVDDASLKLLFDGASRLGDHLGPILYQLPPTFRRDEATAARLGNFAARLPREYRHVFEFRDESWFVEPTFEELDGVGAGFCAFDMPGIECPLRVTGGLLYMRFHGTGQRYGGDYPPHLLADWASRLKAAAGDAETGWVYFNNDIGGFAPRNALELRRLLTGNGGRG